jgi:hypothetical protein
MPSRLTSGSPGLKRVRRDALPTAEVSKLSWRKGTSKQAVSEHCRLDGQLPQAGFSKVPGLFAVPRHSVFRSLLAFESARRTPSASKSLQ